MRVWVRILFPSFTHSFPTYFLLFLIVPLPLAHIHVHKHTHTHTRARTNMYMYRISLHGHYHQHHTVQVAMHAHVHIKFASCHRKNHHQCKVQVMPTASACEVFALIDGRKNTTSANCRGTRPSWALVGAGCSNKLQVAQGHILQQALALVLPAFGCCILEETRG